MNAILFAGAFAMTVVAFAFVVMPLCSRAARGHSKFFFPAVTAVMLSGIALYAAIGRPDAVDSESHLRSAAKSPVDTAGKQELASVNQMLAGLEERLRQQPDDGKGWLLLAKSYDHLGRKADSVNAYTRARELGVEDNAPPASVAGEAPATRYPHDSRGIESVDSLVD